MLVTSLQIIIISSSYHVRDMHVAPGRASSAAACENICGGLACSADPDGSAAHVVPQVSYRSYWSRVVLELLQQHRGNLSIKDISELTAIKKEDIVDTLHSLSLIKYWKGDHIISVTPRIIEEHLRTMSTGHTVEVDPGSLVKARIPPVMRTAKK